ncbi:MAG: hypothetical protein JO287_18295 [Pseudonocardiales bacterium]|nr:hypothetical protein [Pseudonocardiales bacterium]
MSRVSPRRASPQRLDQDRIDANHLGQCAAALRTETSQARYTNRQLDPYPLYGLAELFDTLGREVRTGQLDPRNPIRRSAVALAIEFWRTIDSTP